MLIIFQNKLKNLLEKNSNKFSQNTSIGYRWISGVDILIGFIDFKLKGKSLLGYTNLFSPSVYEKNIK